MLREIHLLSPQPNQVSDANGQEVVVDEDFIKEIYDSYDPSIHEAPVIIGHDSDGFDEMPDWVPAYGWVKDLKLKNGSLYAVVELSEKLKEWLSEKFYKKVSAGLYRKDNPINPTQGQNYLRHLAFLGAAPPAIKGLEQFQFGEGKGLIFNSQVIEFIEESTTEKDMPKGKGYKKDPQLGEMEKEKEVELREGMDDDLELKEGQKMSPEEVDEVSEEKEPELTEDEKTVDLQESDIEMGGMKDKDIVLQEEEEEEEEEEEDVDLDPATLDSPEQAQKFLDANAADLIASIIAEGDKGYKGEITRFDPEPTADNNWLFDDEGDVFSGRFIDDSLGEPEIYDFEIIRNDDDSYTKSFKIVEAEPEEVEPEGALEPALEEEEDTTLREDIDPEMGEYGYSSEMEEENKMLRHMLMKMKKEMHMMKSKQNKGFADYLYSEGKITPAMVSQEDLIIFLDNLSDEEGRIQFSEGSGNPSPLSFVKSLLESLPKQINFGEMPLSANDTGRDLEYDAPVGTMASPEGEILHKKVLSYIDSEGLNKDKDYVKAYKVVMKKEGMI